ncbi:MAG TPA: MBL fold metallo-hydrolase [Casimicrobiaceae bacterium]|nr:MBL fold metallo-hydrolase [Casimicrobiaceae bacterium]
MRLSLYGGFGEKGRTCIGVESDGYRIVLDAGVKTSARGADYYPAVAAETLCAIDAIVVTHGHEDHAAALGWCIAGGFRGRIFMTPETWRDARSALEGYAEPRDARLAEQAKIEPLPLGDDALRLGPFRVSTGRAGHVAGGVWCRVDDARVSFDYCGDVVPASPVFAMDPLPRCQAVAIDASYGDDDVSANARADQIRRWIESHPEGCVLPTPLYGRSAELLAVVPGPVALAPGMREALRSQVEGTRWVVDDARAMLAARLDAAKDWDARAPLPEAALLCHDGMGISGPARSILERARSHGSPTLFTGHLPEGSPGERMVSEGRADWIRLPTHPTLAENRALAAACGAGTVLGHSCEPAVLARLARHLPRLRAALATGDCLDL